jgi:hypothetical protein
MDKTKTDIPTYSFNGHNLIDSWRMEHHRWHSYLENTNEIYDFSNVAADHIDLKKLDDREKIILGLVAQNKIHGPNNMNSLIYGRLKIEKDKNNDYLFTMGMWDFIKKIRINTKLKNISVQLWQKERWEKIVDAVYNNDKGYYYFPDFEENYLPNCDYNFYLKILSNSGNKLDELNESDYDRIEVSVRSYILDMPERKQFMPLQPLLIPFDTISKFLYVNNIHESYGSVLLGYEGLRYEPTKHYANYDCDYDYNYDFEEDVEKYLTITI